MIFITLHLYVMQIDVGISQNAYMEVVKVSVSNFFSFRSVMSKNAHQTHVFSFSIYIIDAMILNRNSYFL